MADTTTTRLALTAPEVGASADTWGTKLNADLEILDTAVQVNTTSKTLSASDVTLTDKEAAASIILLSGTLLANVNIIIPLTYKREYVVRNSTTGAFTVTVKTPAGTGVLIPQGTSAKVFNDGTNISLSSLDINSLTSKTTPVDADFLPLMDSAAGNILKKLSWANLKATLNYYTQAAADAKFKQYAAATTYTASGTIADAVATSEATATINSASATTQTLPSAANITSGKRLNLVNIGAGLATVQRAASETILINGVSVTSIALRTGETSSLESNGSNAWTVVGGTQNATTSKIQQISATVAANALTVSLSPTVIDFRSATVSSGTVNTRTVNSSISLTVPSGATLGTSNAVEARLMVIAIDNAGTVELAIVNPYKDLAQIDESSLISTTAISTGSDSTATFYSTTARSNVPFRVVGYLDVTEATGGIWATAPSSVQGIGGLGKTMSEIVFGGTQQTTSGTTKDFAVPVWAKRINVLFNGCSTNGSSSKLVQLGSGSVQTTGYTSTWAGTSSTSGFVIDTTGSGDAVYGCMTLQKIDADAWVESVSGRITFGSASAGGGSVNLSGPCTILRYTTENGTDQHDSGSVTVTFE